MYFSFSKMVSKQIVIIIDKVYIDGTCGSKTLAGVLLACFERVSHVTHFLVRPIGIVRIQYSWALEYDRARKFP